MTRGSHSCNSPRYCSLCVGEPLRNREFFCPLILHAALFETPAQQPRIVSTSGKMPEMNVMPPPAVLVACELRTNPMNSETGELCVEPEITTRSDKVACSWSISKAFRTESRRKVGKWEKWPRVMCITLKPPSASQAGNWTRSAF